jgi:hypothetical protein
VTKICIDIYRKWEKSRVLNIIHVEGLQIADILEICYVYDLLWKYVKTYIYQSGHRLFCLYHLSLSLSNLMHKLYFAGMLQTKASSRSVLSSETEMQFSKMLGIIHGGGILMVSYHNRNSICIHMMTLSWEVNCFRKLYPFFMTKSKFTGLFRVHKG